MGDCLHDLAEVGGFSVSGDTWSHAKILLYCGNCHRWFSRTIAFLDFAKRTPAEVTRIRQEEIAEFEKLKRDYLAHMQADG